MSNTLERFIQEYAAALENKDVAHLTACCSRPTVFVSDEKKRVCNSSTDLDEANQHFLSLLNNGGVARLEPKILQSMRLSDAFQFVSVRWTFYDAQQQMLFYCNCSYTLQTTLNGELKIVVVVLDDEQSILQQLQSS